MYHTVTTISDTAYYHYKDQSLREHFRSYIDLEEEQIRKNLLAINYDVDAADTVQLVTGPGRIERVSFLGQLSNLY